ncbi:hypothetical protein BC936DRAFT_139750 [Jimgerdemannia flammicorona]|uniref:Uncharacterized protein n=1 Tax=Jimgerdemannia flammicorona TaxID=994334 RepID=A0A433B9B8_9FUNG|nr:hypothetical protein BC936DRAFT_139750 [Jimgerdemannia flammicorona]
MNLKQSLEMTQTMNSVMEQFLQSSIKIMVSERDLLRVPSGPTDTKILQSTDTPSQPTLVIAITNTSQFPIHNVSGQISFQPPSADLDQASLSPSPPTIALTLLTSTRRAIRPPTTSVTAPALFMTPPALTTLVPLTRHTETVRLVPSVLAQFNATVTLRFPSPGTGKALGVEHGFGVYLADQLSKHVHPSSDPVSAPWDTEGSATLTRSYSVGFLREIMCFNPAFGVEAGMWVGLVGAGGNGKTVSLTCLIRSIDLTHSLAECAIYETGPMDAAETGESKLAGRLVMELDVLARVEGGDSEAEGEGA